MRKIFEKNIDNVNVFYADVSELDLDKEYRDISQYRREKISRLRRDADKRLSLGCELLLIYAVKKLCPTVAFPLEIEVGKNGKPAIKGRNDIHFSLAHSGSMAVCAVADTEIGVDTEQTCRENKGVAEKYFDAREREFDFSYIWTRKEAALKADGGGIALGLDTFSVAEDTITLNGITYHLSSFKPEITGYYISFCVR